MDERSPREILENLITEHRANYGALSRLLGRNSAYIQQFIKRGTPRKLDEEDRRALAEYFGVDEALLGGPVRQHTTAETSLNAGLNTRKKGNDAGVAFVPRLDLEASAGAGALTEEEKSVGAVGFDSFWLRRLGLNPKTLSIIEVKGESMAPTLYDGDTIMVDRSDAIGGLRDGVYVLRLDDALMVKRVLASDKKKRLLGRSIAILSDNQDYPSWPDVDLSRVGIIGRVVWTAHLLR